MNHEDLKQTQRAEVAARLSMLDILIDERRALIAQNGALGFDTTLSEQRLRLLLQARQLHRVVFAAAYGNGVLDHRVEE
jgi:hypothetical protein